MRILDLENLKSIVDAVKQELEGKHVKFIGVEYSPNCFTAGSRANLDQEKQNKINSDSLLLKKIVFSEFVGEIYFLMSIEDQNIWCQIPESYKLENFFVFIQNNCSIELQSKALDLQKIDWNSKEHFTADQAMKKLCDEINQLQSIGPDEANTVVDLIFSDPANKSNIQKRYFTFSLSTNCETGHENNTFKIMLSNHSRIVQSILDCYNPYKAYNFDGSMKIFTKPI